MQIDTFTQALRGLGLDWHINTNGSATIRCERNDCPIMALGRSRGLVGYSDDNGDWQKVANELGLTNADALMIIGAADDNRPAQSAALSKKARHLQLRARFERWAV